ncbi:BZ3500_MvSof-1268-A1-R1_Chr2-1g04405 [Microbotryum saponariae]|uniref:BZ3500_MvSof-1268-A1-R1_Chr2-1g04405 protein n=1 Tax=Microbotryum saponariae TaxID=289078 RepID=A0A2X0KEX5_9BASI|nr:BZ3500_MvSof-1268-A1-R1_Chr2-1g04405 [Microbotryum saponariae]SCZ91619.1 BZ3501_MvSof-1269-A2-R1_Chr2-1g04061 [Microbotryum saponariae]
MADPAQVTRRLPGAEIERGVAGRRGLVEVAIVVEPDVPPDFEPGSLPLIGKALTSKLSGP